MATTRTKHKTKLSGWVLGLLALPLMAAGLWVSPVNVFAAGTTRYVDSTGSGSDSGDCSDSDNPCETIQYAINQAASGDTVQAAAGAYSEIVTINKQLTLKGAQAGQDARSRSGAETILQTVGGQDKAIRIAADGVTVDGFTIDGTTGTNSLGVVLGSPSSKNATVVNNIIKNNKVGIDGISTDISGFVAQHNLFDNNNVSGASDGIFLGNTSGSNIEIANNEFRGTDDGSPAASAAINAYGTVGNVLSDVRIQNNKSSNDGAFLLLFAINNVTITGNTASDEASTAVRFDLSTSNVTLQNNTFTNAPYGVRFTDVLLTGGDPITNVNVLNNTITGMSTAAVGIDQGSIGSGITVGDNIFRSNAAGIVNAAVVQITAYNNTDGAGIATPSTVNTGTGGFAAQHSWYGLILAGAAVILLAGGAVLGARRMAVKRPGTRH